MVLLVVLLSPSFTRLVICRPRVPENTRPHTSPSRASSRGQSLQTVRGARAAYCSSCCPVGRAATRRPLRGPARATHDPSTTRSPRAASPRPGRASASSRGGAATRPRTLRLAARRRRDPSADPRLDGVAATRQRISVSRGVAATRPQTCRGCAVGFRAARDVKAALRGARLLQAADAVRAVNHAIRQPAGVHSGANQDAGENGRTPRVPSHLLLFPSADVFKALAGPGW